MLNSEWLKIFAPIGVLNEKKQWNAVGAGVFFLQEPIVWFVTAYHVIRDLTDHHCLILVGHKTKKIIPIDLTAIHTEHDIDWVCNTTFDIAASPVPIFSDFTLKALKEDNCFSLEKISLSMTAYTMGCPYGLRGFDPTSTDPLVQQGIIAGVNRQENIIYTTTPTFPGNSGGPLLVEQKPYNASGGMGLGKPTIYCGGIITEYGLIKSAVQKGAPEGLPNFHFGIARPTDKIIELLKSDDAKKLTNKLSSKSEPTQ